MSTAAVEIHGPAFLGVAWRLAATFTAMTALGRPTKISVAGRGELGWWGMCEFARRVIGPGHYSALRALETN